MGKILLVDNDLASRVLIIDIAENMGYSVTLFDHQASKIQTEYIINFDLIILEIFNNGVSSLNFLSSMNRLAEMSGLKRPPVIVLTDYSSTQAEAAARSEHINFYMLKPLENELLVTRITEAIKLSRCCVLN